MFFFSQTASTPMFEKHAIWEEIRAQKINLHGIIFEKKEY